MLNALSSCKGRVIQREAVGMFQSMVRFRNILIHIYDIIMPMTLSPMGLCRHSDFSVFIEQIRSFKHS